jgi:hypothetical protein
MASRPEQAVSRILSIFEEAMLLLLHCVSDRGLVEELKMEDIRK